MIRTFIISDTHIDHKNIIPYENRPFLNLDQMKKEIIKNWNSIVTNEDKVFHLGDVCFGNKEVAKDFVSKLNGKKYLIMGNHDKSHSVKWWLDSGFIWVSKYPILYRNFYILSHEPIYINSWIPMINVHGHMHSKKMESSQYINISCECVNYMPVDFEEIKKSSTALIEAIRLKLPSNNREGDV